MPDAALPSPAEVVAFWRDAGPKRWFARDEAFDAEIRTRFGPLHQRAATTALDGWTDTAEGALALVVTLDQFPRNMHRDSALAFATDGLARAAALRTHQAGHAAAFAPQLRAFLLMPWTHSEQLADQERGVALFKVLAAEAPDTGESLRFARLHRDIVARFGRFPHRNRVLGRTTTPEEQAFLDGGGFAG